GNRQGVVGCGYGKAREVPVAIQKAVEKARHSLFRIPLQEGGIPYEVIGKFGASKVFLKPAGEGTGVIAGGAVRALLELAGIRNVFGKSYGSRNPVNLVKAAADALQILKDPEEVAKLRGKTLQEIFE
ncbi:MAG: 30S ribosomal protein S5, partial [Candidatus Geothermincolia bacterium]